MPKIASIPTSKENCNGFKKSNVPSKVLKIDMIFQSVVYTHKTLKLNYETNLFQFMESVDDMAASP